MGLSPESICALTELRKIIAGWRANGERIGLVPTMGALHDGHLSLVKRAVSECERVIVTIFVNPKQFSPTEDLKSYPRDNRVDLQKLATFDTALVYIPNADQMYGPGFATRIEVDGLTDHLCGKSRPDFFGGVATIVTKLLIQTQPNRVYFGDKDFQQLLVIRRLASDLDIPVDIISCPVIREPDGLALSSRNTYLSIADRATAPALYEIIQQTAERVKAGEPCRAAEAWAKNELIQRGFTKVDYVDIRNEETLDSLDKVKNEPSRARVFAAAYLGTTRLIDNVAATADD